MFNQIKYDHKNRILFYFYNLSIWGMCGLIQIYTHWDINTELSVDLCKIEYLNHWVVSFVNLWVGRNPLHYVKKLYVMLSESLKTVA